MTGLFATKVVNPSGPNGAFYGNPKQLVWQLIAIAVTLVYSFVLSGCILIIIKHIPFFGLRLPEQQEVAIRTVDNVEPRLDNPTAKNGAEHVT